MKPTAIQSDTGAGGLSLLILEHSSGARAEVYPYGAHITSWRPPGQPDAFFVSRESIFEAGTPIRGGIPVIFPQFGDGPLPKHGLARTQLWTVTDSGVLPGGAATVTLTLDDNEATLARWPFRFRAELRLELTERLLVTLRIANRDASPFSFQMALHTYFAVADIHRTQVVGLQGTRLSDSLLANAESVEDRKSIGFTCETDRVYLGAGDTVSIRDEATPRTIVIAKANMPDVVVWNPWIEKSRRLADFGDVEYLRMVCVETGCIAAPISLSPGQTWEGSTSFSARG